MPSNRDSLAASAASLLCSSVNWRVTRSSALIATRSLNALCPLMAGVISLRRKSATALINSVGVGSSCMLVSSRGQQPQQVDLGFRGAAADHRAQALGADDEIAVAEIAVHQRGLWPGTGIAVTQPAQRQFEHRPRPLKTAVVAVELGNFLCGRHAAKAGQFRQRQSMDAGRDLAELARQVRTSACELLVAQNFARDGFALNALHDEAGTEPV